MDTKTCSKCGEAKLLDDFHKQAKARDGYRAHCKVCALAQAAAYRLRNIDACRARDKAHYKKNKEAHRAKNSKWYQDNKVAKREYNREWYAANSDKRAHYQNRRYVAEKQRTVSWANDQLIAAYYKEAKRLEELTGIQFHVDHIIPLQGELVSGLHVETNLQLLPAHENLGKSNSFDPELFVA
jgi:hypothetical protein